MSEIVETNNNLSEYWTKTLEFRWFKNSSTRWKLQQLSKSNLGDEQWNNIEFIEEK